MKAILVDDEIHALEALRNALEPTGLIEVAGVFTNPLEAIDFCREGKIDAVFLDIEMPGMNGLEAAEKIQEVCGAEVVFVTAYDHYAVEAFEVNAVDYLLKPASPKRAVKTAERLLALKRTHQGGKTIDHDDIVCTIRCLGRFDVIVTSADGREELFKWRMSKAKELFAFLLHHRGRTVRKSRITDTLWPEMDAHRAGPYLHTCVYQIRKLIKTFGLEKRLELLQVNEGYELRLNRVECDIDVFLRETANLSSKPTDENIDGLIKLADMYQGNYFDEEDYSWARANQYEYLVTYQELLLKIVDFHQESGEYAKSAAWLLRLIACDPYREDFHNMLLNAYGKIGSREAFIQHFQQLRSLFLNDLGIDLPASIKQLPARWGMDDP